MSYFSGSEHGSGSARIARSDDLRRFEVAPGVAILPMLGERMNLNLVELAPDAVAAVHTHEEEQMGYVVRGSMDFTDGSSTWTLVPGDIYHAAPGVPHGATAHPEGCLVIDAFTPPRAGVKEMLELPPG